MLDFADTYGEGSKDQDDVENKKEARKEAEIKPERLLGCEMEGVCECAEAIQFLDKRAADRESRKTLSKIDVIKVLPNVRLWKLYIKLKSGERPLLCSIVREIIYERYLSDVLSIADNYSRRRLPVKSLAKPEDIQQAAIVAHLEGIDLYLPDFGTTYMQFLNASGNKSRVVGRIIDALRKLQHLPRDVSRTRRDWKKRIESLTHKLRKTPTIEELHDEYGDDATEVSDEPLFEKTVVNQIDEANGEEVSMSEFPVERKLGKTSFAANEDIYPDKDAILKMIPDTKKRFVIDAYYFQGMIKRTIANKLGCSISTVSSLCRQGENSILARMTREEFEGMFR